MARDSGLSVSTVQRIWRAVGLKPHRQETFRLSTDPDFSFPRCAMWWAVCFSTRARRRALRRRKSQIQAFDRSQIVFPMRLGQPQRRSHDHVRRGTTSLSIALDVATGDVIGKCYLRHRAAEFRQFLDEIEAAVPLGLDMHLVWDNYATHKTGVDPELVAEAAALARPSDPDRQFLVAPSRTLLAC